MLAQAATFTGKITAENGTPMFGAAVTLEGLNIQVGTAQSGVYTLTVPAARVTGQTVVLRARAIGFVYSWSRLSTMFTSFMIAFFLENFGTKGVFAFIAASMLMVILSVGVFGPRTNNLSLEEISH